MTPSQRKEADATVESLKSLAISEVTRGKDEVVLDVRGLARRDRDRARHGITFRLGKLGIKCSIKFDDDVWTLTVLVLERGKPEECNHSVVRKQKDDTGKYLNLWKCDKCSQVFVKEEESPKDPTPKTPMERIEFEKEWDKRVAEGKRKSHE